MMTSNAILNPSEFSEMAQNPDERRWQAVVDRDAGFDDRFVFAVSSTGVYCRPSCAARRPRRENVRFFRTTLEAEHAGYRACLRCRPTAVGGNAQLKMVKAICRYIEQHLDEPVTLSRLGEEFHQSPFHLQRTFKAVLRITPRAYADSYRMNQLKQNLRSGHSVTRAMYDAGYGSSSRLYERTASQMGMTPDKYRRGAVATQVRYTIAKSPLGPMLIAATDKGICAIQFADTEEELEQGVKHEFPFAFRKRDDVWLKGWKEQLLGQLRGKEVSATLPLDIQATAFQRRVWTYLQSIPSGETRSYQQVAKSIGQPTAARAVARACATNPVALAIPCHRIVRENGDMGGYRWGMGRKKTLLEIESQNAEA
ncbi:MAG TPA: bifunctional DNA-binding transcriptional regulator/O6-methylguanine-DNA methyltransferase Ada [Terriglobales bacterium]|jgi:AraC family transcriptional regulator of adaptative response/methylated-DNA-[protein]-cysteine methyltransferase|nr:bifunctional DNA-binding transcriptional regulator/O6-methylguanine-DNA methyltransferase Ada [Terriglobales bacterium]